MSFTHALKNRRVIPRWHTFRASAWLGLCDPLRPYKLPSDKDENYLEHIRAWKNKKSLVLASELVGNALIRNYMADPPALQASNYLLKKRKQLQPTVLELATEYIRLSKGDKKAFPRVLKIGDTGQAYKTIASLKSSTDLYPRNPLLWMDLAYYYTVLGQILPAKRCVRIALALNSDNRHILRSASRFFLHSDDPEQALHILRDSSAYSHDPWLLAAGISISSIIGRTAKKIPSVQSLLSNTSIAPFHLSELASAIGTLEILNGSSRKAEKLFRLALTEPTENTLAQAVGFRDELRQSVEMLDLKASAQSFEARSSAYSKDQNFRAALRSTEEWLHYQPFSSHPAIRGSYIASVALNDQNKAIAFAESGLISSPKNSLLRNNLAFALASDGKPKVAKAELAKIKDDSLSEYDRNIVLATRGLVEFRLENAERGRELYNSAIEFFTRKNEHRAVALATHFYAREETRIQSPQATKLMGVAASMSKKFKLTELLRNSSPKDARLE